MIRSSRQISLFSAVLLATLTFASTPVAQSASAATSKARCSAMSRPVHQPTRRSAAFLTTSSSRLHKAVKGGFTAGKPLFGVSTKSASGLVSARRLVRSSNHDEIIALTSKDIKAAKKLGYKSKGTAFYVSRRSLGSCSIAVHRFRKAKVHRFAAGTTARKALKKKGWVDQGTTFYAAVIKPKAAPKPKPKPKSSPTSGPFGQPLYVLGSTKAMKAYHASSDRAERKLLWQIAGTATPQWLGGGKGDGPGVARLEAAAAAKHQTLQLVLYAIPHRDCGGLAKGGLTGVQQYKSWIDAVRAGIKGRPTVVIVEPDAISMSCLSPARQADRQAMMTYAAKTLSRDPTTWVYIHAGSGNATGYIAPMLRKVGIQHARGFALNVADFQTTASMTTHGHRLNAALGVRKPFVIDTSRNGAGPIAHGSNGGAPYWCNPPGRALGIRPTAKTTDPQVDAYLWIKPPGDSDGVCHPGDPTGWQKSFAVGLASRALKLGTISEFTAK